MGQWSRPVENMALNPTFWRGRSVLVTGHTGFKGSWLSLWLQQLGAQVSGFSLPPPDGDNLFEVAQVGKGMDSRLGDLRAPEAVLDCVRTTAPDVIFHLAAQAQVRPAYAAPLATWATNVMGTAHLLEAIRQAGHCPKVIVVTSDKCYENREWQRPYREDDALGGFDPYSSSKAAVEILVASWRRSYPGAFHLATARAGNVIGGGDWSSDRLIPDLIRAFSHQQPLHLRYPEAIRPWQHVLESLLGYLLLAQHLDEAPDRFASAWNFGPPPEDACSVGDLVQQAAFYWGPDARVTQTDTPQPHEAGLLTLDSQKAINQLGWSNRWNTAQAIRATVDWYREHQQRGDMARYCHHQIEQYLASPPTP